jgi:hypothetical protein
MRFLFRPIRRGTHTSFLIASLFVSAAAVRCDSQTVTQHQLGVPFTMRFGESTRLNDLKLTFRRVEHDTRCPIDAQCITAGDAEITLEIEQGGKAAVASLNTMAGPKTVEWNGYSIALVGISPSPRPVVPVKRHYRVKILVTRQSGQAMVTRTIRSLI